MSDNKPASPSGYTKTPPTGRWGPHSWLDTPTAGEQPPAKPDKQNQYTKTTPRSEWGEHSWVSKIIAEGALEEIREWKTDAYGTKRMSYRSFGKWTLDEEGLLTIDAESKGEMPNWIQFGRTPWRMRNINKAIKKVVISNKITSIGSHAFSDCTSLREITIPNSVTRINECAFMGCTSLREITIPNSVTYIREKAFWGCASLREITIPNSVTDIDTGIEGGLFESCTNLQKVYMPRRFDRLFFKFRFGISKDIVTFT